MSEEQLFATGLGVIGLGFVIYSITGIVRRRIVLYRRGRREYTGREAIYYGIVFTLFGLAFIAMAFLSYLLPYWETH
jgi:hypothetical protein